MKLSDIGITAMTSAAVLTGVATSAVAQVREFPERNGPYYRGHDMMWDGGQWGGFGMLLGPIFAILLVVAIIVAVVYLSRLIVPAGSGVSHPADDRALALLKERYAKGEIDSDEFAERKKHLST